MDWTPPQKPSELTENRIIEAILSGQFPVDSTLPGERDFAGMLGVTRPTLREALQRLARDGWIEIRQGHPTRVRNFWQEGQLAVLISVVQHPDSMPANMIANLLKVRSDMAPTYTALAITNAQPETVACLKKCIAVEDASESFANIDWELHHSLTIYSGNPVYTLILNGFKELYQQMGIRYFRVDQARAASRQFYTELLAAAQNNNAGLGAKLTRIAMETSQNLWSTIP